MQGRRAGHVGRVADDAYGLHASVGEHARAGAGHVVGHVIAVALRGRLGVEEPRPSC